MKNIYIYIYKEKVNRWLGTTLRGKFSGLRNFESGMFFFLFSLSFLEILLLAVLCCVVFQRCSVAFICSSRRWDEQWNREISDSRIPIPFLGGGIRSGAAQGPWGISMRCKRDTPPSDDFVLLRLRVCTDKFE